MKTFTNPPVVPNLYEFFLVSNIKEDILRNAGNKTVDVEQLNIFIFGWTIPILLILNVLKTLKSYVKQHFKIFYVIYLLNFYIITFVHAVKNWRNKTVTVCKTIHFPLQNPFFLKIKKNIYFLVLL